MERKGRKQLWKGKYFDEEEENTNAKGGTTQRIKGELRFRLKVPGEDSQYHSRTNANISSV